LPPRGPAAGERDRFVLTCVAAGAAGSRLCNLPVELLLVRGTQAIDGTRAITYIPQEEFGSSGPQWGVGSHSEDHGGHAPLEDTAPSPFPARTVRVAGRYWSYFAAASRVEAGSFDGACVAGARRAAWRSSRISGGPSHTWFRTVIASHATYQMCAGAVADVDERFRSMNRGPVQFISMRAGMEMPQGRSSLARSHYHHTTCWLVSRSSSKAEKDLERRTSFESRPSRAPADGPPFHRGWYGTVSYYRASRE